MFIFPAFSELSFFGKGLAVSKNNISLTCGSPFVQEWLAENDKCKKEDADDPYWTHKDCIHVQVWKPSTGDGQCCSCIFSAYRIEKSYVYKI